MKVTKKVTKKVLLLGLAITMLLTTSIPAFALPGNTVVVGDKAYSMDYFFDASLNAEIVAAINAGGDIYFDATGTGNNFKDAWNGNAITDAQKAAINNINYLNYDGTKSTYAKFDDKTPTNAELTVKSATAVNATTISVTFSNDVVQQFTVSTLTAGANTRTVTYLGKSYTIENITYIPPVVTVLEVKRDNYRHFQVIFNGVVDLNSAKKAENYYFFINEGNADYKSILPASNQLDTIVEKIEAKNENGKTVVDIYLPEDNRFTNIADFLPQLPSQPDAEYLQQIPVYNGWYEVYGFDTQAWIDDEQSIIANLANKVHGTNSKYWALTAGREVQVAVRNIRDVQLQRSIDTAVLPMIIKDDVRPAWTGVQQVENTFVQLEAGYKAAPVVPVYTDGSEMVRLSFNEPVFNTHGLGVADKGNTGHYNVEVAVDDNKVASTDDQNLSGILKFYMGADDSYAQSCLADLNIKAAIERAYTDGFRADNTYSIKITGITDLAGNIIDPQVLEFKVSLRDPNGSGGIVIPAPKIIDVKQIHDNVFRVYMNRDDVTGVFEIRNGDGEDGLITYQIANFSSFLYSKKINDQKVWYRDVIVPAVDMERSLGIGVRDDQLLAYDRQNTLKRTIRVSEVAAIKDDLTGNSFECSFTNGNEFTLNKDIYAPEVKDPAIIPWNEIGTTIALDVKDIVPGTWATDDKTAQPVYAMLYDYVVQEQYNNLPYGLFNFNSIDTAATEAYNMPAQGYYANIDDQYDFDLLPIVVSYTKDGIKHSAVVSNRCLLNEFANNPAESGRHYGAPGSISYDFINQQLKLNLNSYIDLLGSDGKLVQGVNYEIEIPNGYFADQARINAYNYTNTGAVDSTNAVYFVPSDKILYVSDDRNNNNGNVAREYTIPEFVGNGSASYMVHGYTSAADVVTQAVGVAPVIIPEPKDGVPQTSKELINWFEDRNEIWVEFTGPDTNNMDAATLKNPENYVLNDKTLAAMGVTSEDIKYVVSSENMWNGDLRQFAQIKLPFDTITVDGDYLFKVSGVSNKAGGTMTPVEVRLDIDENFRPVIEKAVVIGNHEIELTFNESVRYTADPAIDPENLAVASKDNFVVYVNGVAYTPMTATVGTTPLTPNDNPNPTYPLNKVVRLNLGSVELLGNSISSITVDIVKNQNGKLLMEDSKCNPLNDVVAPFKVK